MEPFHFTCPHCTARLRVRDRVFVGRQVDCPECHVPMVIVEEGAGFTASAAPDVQGASPAAAVRQKPAVLGPSASSVASPARLPAWWQNSTVIAWGIAAGCSLAVVVPWLLFSGPAPSAPGVATNALPAEGAAVVEPQAPAVEHVRPDSKPGVPEVEPVRPWEIARHTEGRLEELGRVLSRSVAEEGHFPAGVQGTAHLPPERRLSWQAALVDYLPKSAKIHVVWDRGWQDPLNDLFVRRRIEQFQNPSISELTGADSYPATHFVGMAGLGSDARELDVSDARAGVFGDNRRTRPEDIHDGLSNTLLVAGVREHLGSWASGGQATVRGFDRQPEVNGPDGFGTGQNDSMFVLLADGSVRKIDAQVDSSVLRSMATIAGEKPVSSTTEHDNSPAALAEASPMIGVILNRGKQADKGGADDGPAMTGNPVAGDTPLEPEFVGDGEAAARQPATVEEVEAALDQKILGFQQSKTALLDDVLQEVSRMAGVPIRYELAELDASSAAAFQQPVDVKLLMTSIREILNALLRPAKLTFRVEPGGIRLVPAGK